MLTLDHDAIPRYTAAHHTAEALAVELETVDRELDGLLNPPDSLLTQAMQLRQRLAHMQARLPGLERQAQQAQRIMNLEAAEQAWQPLEAASQDALVAIQATLKTAHTQIQAFQRTLTAQQEFLRQVRDLPDTDGWRQYHAGMLPELVTDARRALQPVLEALQ